MDKSDRVRACYLHACLCYVMRTAMTNTTIRKRLGINDSNAATASRILNEAVDAGMIIVRNPEEGTRSRTYLPYWAASASTANSPGGVA